MQNDCTRSASVCTCALTAEALVSFDLRGFEFFMQQLFSLCGRPQWSVGKDLFTTHVACCGAIDEEIWLTQHIIDVSYSRSMLCCCFYDLSLFFEDHSPTKPKMLMCTTANGKKVFDGLKRAIVNR